MSTRSSTLPRSQALDATLTSQKASGSPASKPLEINTMKNLYSADQQVKFLHLHAEVETLLLQLQTLKKQRQDLKLSQESN